jgi:acid phosphatase (class A)
MKSQFALLPSLLLIVALPLAAKDAPSVYFPASAIDVKALLPAPPDADQTRKEIETVLQLQSTRTPDQLAHIKLEEHYSVYVFSDVVGRWFKKETAKTTPEFTALLREVADTTKPIVVGAKNGYKRPRPFLQDARVVPPIEKPKDPSYPSGHSTLGTLDALVLAAAMPDLAAELKLRGERVGDDRVIAGVHFPSDVAAGRILGQAIFDQLMATPKFKDDLAKAKAELVAVRARSM